ncbi:MAG TPA: SdpI family protein, partial [Verrucomicrobiae bacterium]|nr:SdpI family protein [Verrucomicrobiae bacterium]
MSSQPFFVPAVIILVVSLPLILGLIPRNRVYGIRTRKALSDDRTRYSVNRFGGGMILAASVFYLIVALIS